MKSLLTLAAVIAALALAAPAGAMPLYDHPVSSHQQVASPPPADTSDGTPLLVFVLVAGVAFLGGAAAVRLVPVPRRRATAT
jgi:hypothetical protein